MSGFLSVWFSSAFSGFSFTLVWHFLLSASKRTARGGWLDLNCWACFRMMLSVAVTMALSACYGWCSEEDTCFTWSISLYGLLLAAPSYCFSFISLGIFIDCWTKAAGRLAALLDRVHQSLIIVTLLGWKDRGVEPVLSSIALTCESSWV